MAKNEIKQRDRPGLWAQLSHAWDTWVPGVLLLFGAAALTVGAALIYAPAGWITGGVLAIAGGVLGAIGGGGEG